MKKLVLNLCIIIIVLFSMTNNTLALNKREAKVSTTATFNTTKSTNMQCGKKVLGDNIICDINKDKVINSTDAELVLKYTVQSTTFTSDQSILADANGDGTVNTSDAVFILRYISGKLEDPNNETTVCEKVYYKGCRVGDINCDNNIDEEDANLVLKYAVQSTTFTSNQLLLAEVNGDKKVNTGDATTILRFVEGRMEYFPVECKTVTSTPISDPIDTPNNTPTTPITDEPVTNPKTSDMPILLIIIVCVVSLGIAIYEILKLKKINE